MIRIVTTRYAKCPQKPREKKAKPFHPSRMTNSRLPSPFFRAPSNTQSWIKFQSFLPYPNCHTHTRTRKNGCYFAYLLVLFISHFSSGASQSNKKKKVHSVESWLAKRSRRGKKKLSKSWRSMWCLLGAFDARKLFSFLILFFLREKCDWVKRRSRKIHFWWFSSGLTRMWAFEWWWGGGKAE